MNKNPKKLVFASHNLGKYNEMSTLLTPHNIDLIFLGDHSKEDIEETGLSFHENALLKARKASQLTGLPALGDDSGLCVKALNNRPGIYSARYNGIGSSFESKMLKLLDELKSTDDREAFFICVLAYVKQDNDPIPRFFEGLWHGSIANQIKGSHGFGYDPIFFDPELNMCVGEMSHDMKIELSHRAKATKLFVNERLPL
ncbi:MAG: RdgB/HAM1 family non-canonical purine NTP pyrophosphatase [Pseudomonadota bacterium]|nr:RdgB/HAM1 family non-canonical purine NTP pyrophosphatase [Pseudomonadota bacterium]